MDQTNIIWLLYTGFIIGLLYFHIRVKLLSALILGLGVSWIIEHMIGLAVDSWATSPDREIRQTLVSVVLVALIMMKFAGILYYDRQIIN